MKGDDGVMPHLLLVHEWRYSSGAPHLHGRGSLPLTSVENCSSHSGEGEEATSRDGESKQECNRTHNRKRSDISIVKFSIIIIFHFLNNSLLNIASFIVFPESFQAKWV